jgi:hypothetical protein
MNREECGVPGLALTRLKPVKIVAPHGPMRAGMRGPSLFETLEALLGRAGPPAVVSPAVVSPSVVPVGGRWR